MLTVSVVDDDQMLLDGIRAWLATVADVTLRRTARTVDELLDGDVRADDVVILDLLLADHSDPVDNVRRLVAAGSRVLVISVVASAEQGRRVVRAGAAGYLTKDHDLGALLDTVREVAACGEVHSPELAFAWLADRSEDRPVLSPQERAILLAYASGMTLTAAARKLGIQPATAKNYLDRVKEKYRRAGRPTYTKLDLASRVREDGLLR